MNHTPFRLATAGLVAVLTCLFTFSPTSSVGQWEDFSLSPADAFRGVRAEVGWLRNTTRTAPNLVRDGYDNLRARFQSLRASFNRFQRTLDPDQQARVVNELAELSGGLDIIQEVFGDSSQGAAESQANPAAFRRMCGVLDRAVACWAAEFDRVGRLLNLR